MDIAKQNEAIDLMWVKQYVRGTAWYPLATRGLVLGGGVGGGVGRMVHYNSYSDNKYDCSYQ